MQEERYRPSRQHRKGKRIPQAWMDHRRSQQVFRKEKPLSPPQSCTAVLGRQPSLSKRSLSLASPEGRAELLGREPRVCDLGDLEQLFLLCLVLSQMLLVPVMAPAQGWTFAILHVDFPLDFLSRFCQLQFLRRPFGLWSPFQ